MQELRILVTGKTGQGKSTLINGILGARVAVEGAGAKRCTTQVEMFSKTIKGVPIKVFDSPGLQDRTANEDEYIQGMRETCQELSLVLYCTKMINTRLTDDDKNAMVKLTRAFGEGFWNYSVFVLTFANLENVTRKDDRDADEEEPDEDDEAEWKELEKRRFQGRLETWKKEIQKFLVEELKVTPKIVCHIPVVPAGDNRETHKNPYYNKLPDRENWFDDFWETCIEREKKNELILYLGGIGSSATEYEVLDKHRNEYSFEEAKTSTERFEAARNFFVYQEWKQSSENTVSNKL